MKTITAKRTGKPKVVILNAFPRICSRNSRFATRSMLRMAVIASHGADKNLFERRLDQFKTIDRSHGCRLAQQLLRIAGRLQPDFRMAGKILRLGNLRALKKVLAAF